MDNQQAGQRFDEINMEYNILNVNSYKSQTQNRKIVIEYNS